MDLNRILAYLRAERARLDATIAALEPLAAEQPKPVRSRPGRRNMGPEERKLVSARMRKYWASRRRAENPKIAGHDSKPGGQVTC